MHNITEGLNDYRIMIGNELKRCVASEGNLQKVVYDAMQYSLLLGGKRIRPILMLEFYRISGGDIRHAINFACAIEMIHTYSLVHDDLPCMDNDDLRRGKPSCHKVFGEDIALLAGDGLLTLAFETALGTKDIPPDRIIKSARLLADCAGAAGMIGGQVIDLQSEEKDISIDTMLEMYKLKTGKLITVAAEIGCILAGASNEKISAAVNYSTNLGLCFQIIDDILDSIGDEKTLGKPIGSDLQNSKSTYVSLMGMDVAKNKAEDLSNKAKESLWIFGEEAKFLKELTDLLFIRKS